MLQISEYEQQAVDFLTKAELEFRAVLIGNDCPTFCKDAKTDTDMDKLDTYPRRTHIHGKHYRCTISSKGRGHVSFDFWNSYSDEEYNALGSKKYQYGETMLRYDRKGKRIPVAYDLLACITKYDPGSFENFCGDYGYDTDSRKAEETYRAVVKEYAKVCKFFTDAELEQLGEIL